MTDPGTTNPATPSPAPPAGQTFMIQRMGAEAGPYSIPDLQAQARASLLKSNTLARRADGTGTWFLASEIPGLFSTRDFVTALLLSVFLGTFGIDRFYLGYTGLGVLKLITCGLCGIWTLIDIFLIALDRLPDASGLPIRH
jgi:TM2 domain-containing membrane protein YozV